MDKNKDETEKKEYEKPAIKHELDLEVKAGSPCLPDLFDPLNPFGGPPC